MFTGAEVAAMRQVAARPDLRGDDRAALGFALGKALEDAGEYEASFGCYAAGAAARCWKPRWRCRSCSTSAWG